MIGGITNGAATAGVIAQNALHTEESPTFFAGGTDNRAGHVSLRIALPIRISGRAAKCQNAPPGIYLRIDDDPTKLSR